MTSLESESQLPSERTLRVLIVEDCAPDVEVTVATLKRVGFHLTYRVVDSPQTFQQELEQTEYDIILADYNLRTWNAMDALEGLRRFKKDIPFILVTGTLGDEAAVECIKQGVTDYVLKDRLVRLPTVVTRALADKALRDERRRAEEALRESEAHYRLVAETATDAIISIDEDSRILFVNPAAEAIFGYTRVEMLGQQLTMLMPAYRREIHRTSLKRYVETGERQIPCEALELAGLHKCGREIPLEVSMGENSYDGKPFSTCILRDVSERQKLEERFRQSQKMEAVGRLAGGIAHDFNNLLTVITGFSDLLLGKPGSDATRREYAGEIRKAGERAALLTRQLLAFSRQQILLPEILDLNAVVGEVDSMLRRLIGEDIDLKTPLAPNLGRVKADPGQIQQILMNLAVNARDAMPQGGKLTIETANVELDSAYARTHAEVKPGSYVMLAVSDTGTGMVAEIQARIFEPFFTTKEKGKGTGLGLATVYGIVKQSGGNIWVYSEPGRGTSFKIYLPQVGQVPATTAPPIPCDARAGASETILLVEDEVGVRALARRVLELHGFRVLEADRGEDALQISERHEGPIHLLLTDVIMPGMSGRALADRLGTGHPETRVLFMSGYTDEAIVHHGVLESGIAFLQKPFTPDSLARKVRETLGVKNPG